MATTNPPMIAAPSDLAEDKDNSTIPFPAFDATVLAKTSTRTSTSTQSGAPRSEPPFDPFASGKGYPEFPSRCSNIVRGFPVHNDDLPATPPAVRCFPPPSNVAYERALQSHFATRRDTGEEAMRPRMQRLQIVVPQNGYFRELEVDRTENWRPGRGRKEEGPVGLGIGNELRKRVGDNGNTLERGLSEEGVGIGKIGDEMGEIDEAAEVREVRMAEEIELAGQIALAEERDEVEDSGESEDEGLFMDANLSRGEQLARNINFRRDSCVTTAPGVSGDILPAEEQREEFIDDINNNGEQLEFCTVCETKHIPPGPPITLADRDTCGSLLPKWFPSRLVARPWDTYRALINELVALEEKAEEQRARVQDRDRPRWDLEWHEAGPEWAAAGRREGWWRCRSGPEAPDVERRCQVCHGEREAGERRLTVGEEDEMREERKRVLQGFIDQQVKLFGEMDKEVALARIQLESMGLMNGGGGEGEALAEVSVVSTREEETGARDLEEILGSTTLDEPEESSGSDSEDSEPESLGSSQTFFF